MSDTVTCYKYTLSTSIISLFQRKPIHLNKKATDVPSVQVHNNMTVEQLASAIGRGMGTTTSYCWCHVSLLSHGYGPFKKHIGCPVQWSPFN